jgi:hypothetical protein
MWLFGRKDFVPSMFDELHINCGGMLEKLRFPKKFTRLR